MQTNKKKLVIFMPAMEGGGVEKNIVIISNYLSKYIKNIELITYDRKFNNFFDKKIKIINFSQKKNDIKNKYYKYFFCLLLLIKSFFQNKETYIFAFQANIYCIILAIIFRKKIITRSNSSPSGWNKNILKNFLFKILFKYPIKIIVNSKSFKNEIDKKFKINSKMIYNPLNKKDIILKSKQKIENNFFKKTNKLKIINVSRFTDQKDHITLLKAFNIVSQKIPAKLLLIGYGSNKDKIKKYINSKKLNKKVKILKFTYNPYNYIKNSDLFVLTSLYEGLPNVILEAITLKKYVVSTNCPTGPSEILQKGEFGSLFPIRNFKKLSKVILDFYFFKKKYQIKIKKAYISLNRFDKIKNCNLYLNEVKKLMEII